MTEKEPKIAIIGAGMDAQTAAEILAKIQAEYPNDEIIIVENVEDLKKLDLKNLPKQPEQEMIPFKNYNKNIPDIDVLTYGNPPSGKELRRERRAKERRSKKK